MEIESHLELEGIDLHSKRQSSSLYKFYYQLNELRLTTCRDITTIYTKSIHYLLKFWEAIQILSLVLPLSHNRKTSEFDWFYMMILGIRTDFLSARFDTVLPNFVISSMTICLPILTFLYALLKSVKLSKPLSGSVLMISYSIPFAISKLVIFVCILCNSLSPIVSYTCGEYLIFRKCLFMYRDLSYTIVDGYTAVVSIIMICLFIVSVIFDTLFVYEQGVVYRNISFYSRAHSRFECLKYIIITLVCFSYYFISQGNIYLVHFIAHISICISLGTLLSYIYITYLPFYNTEINTAEAFKFGALAFGGIAQLISYLQDDELVLVVLVIFCLPVLFIIMHELVKKRVRYVSQNYEEIMPSLRNVYIFELVLRYRIYDYQEAKSAKDYENLNQAEARIDEYFRHAIRNFKNLDLILIWECLYYYYIRKKETVAGLKLCFAKSNRFDFESNFLKFKYLKMLEEQLDSDVADIEYLKYLELYNEAKYLDSELCLTLLKFWNELIRTIPRFDRLCNLAIKLHMELDNSLEKSKHLYEKYPNNRKVCKLYGSFLISIYNDYRKGQEILLKVENFQSALDSRAKFIALDQITFIDENIGVMLISGDSKSLGTIRFINQAASILLELPPNSAYHNHFSVHCPPPLNDLKRYNEKLRHYLEHTRYSEIPVPSLSLMITSKGNLIEIYHEVRCMAYNSLPIFICTFKRIEEERECALLSDSNVILAHTKGLGDLVGDLGTRQSYCHMHIKEILPEFEDVEQKAIEVFNYRNGKSFYVMLDIRIIGSVSFRIVYLTGSILGESIDTTSISRFTTSDTNNLRKCKTILNIIFDSKLNVKHESPLAEKQEDESQPILKKIQFNTESQSLMSERISSSYSHGLPSLMTPKESSIEYTTLKSEENIDNRFPVLKSKSLSQSVSNSSAIASSTVISLMKTLKGSIFRLKMYSFITIFAIILGVVTITIYVFYISDQFQKYTIVKELSDVRSYTILQSANVRNLNLLNQGLIPAESESFLRKYAMDQVAQLDKIFNQLKKKIASWDLDRQQYINDQKVKAWYLSQDTPYSEDIRLIDGLRNIIRSATAVSQLPISNITHNNPDFYYCFRNGHSGTLAVLNETLYDFIDREQKTLIEIVSLVEMLCIFASIIIVVCSASIFIPSLISVERCHKNIWKFYFRIKNSSLYQMKLSIQERLESMHSIELDLHSEYRCHDLDKHQKKFSYKSNLLKVLLKLSVHFAISIGFIGFFYYWICVKYVGILAVKPTVENWAGMRVLTIHGIFFWYLENIFQHQGLGYYGVVSEYSDIVNIDKELNRYLEVEEYSDYMLIHGPYARKGMNKYHYDLMFNNGITADYNTTFLSKGVHPALAEYIFTIKDKGGNLVQLPSLWMYREALSMISEDLVAEYEMEFKEELADVENVLIWANVCYCVLSIILYFILYVPVVNSLRNSNTKVWELSRLIPIFLIDNSSL